MTESKEERLKYDNTKMGHFCQIEDFANCIKENPGAVEVAMDLLSMVQCYRKHNTGKVNRDDMRQDCKLCGECPHCKPKNW